MNSKTKFTVKKTLELLGKTTGLKGDQEDRNECCTN